MENEKKMTVTEVVMTKIIEQFPELNEDEHNNLDVVAFDEFFKSIAKEITDAYSALICAYATAHFNPNGDKSFEQEFKDCGIGLVKRVMEAGGLSASDETVEGLLSTVMDMANDNED